MQSNETVNSELLCPTKFTAENIVYKKEGHQKLKERQVESIEK